MPRRPIYGDAAISFSLLPIVYGRRMRKERGRSPRSSLAGLEVNTETERVTLPSTKAERLQLVLRNPKWDRGCTDVVLSDVQELVGRMVHFTTVSRLPPQCNGGSRQHTGHLVSPHWILPRHCHDGAVSAPRP